MSKETEIVIIGAGVLGVSLAYHLSLRNIPCVVLEREPYPAAHASGKNAGMLRQLYRHPQLTDWARRSIRNMPQVLKDTHFRKQGSLIGGREVPAHSEDLFEQRTLILESEEIPAVYCASDGLLDSPSYVNDLCRLSKQQGAKYEFHHEVISLTPESAGWKIKCANHTKIRCRTIVNAAGAWVNSFLTDDSEISHSDIQAFARHLLLIEGWEKDYMPYGNCGYYWDERNHWYMRLWNSQSRLVSICDQVACSPESFTPRENILEKVSETLLDQLPLVAKQLSVARSWHCFRSYSEDKLPIFGEDERHPNFFWFAGFGGYGMSTSFAAAEDAANVLTGCNTLQFDDFSPPRTKIHPLRPKVSAIF